MGEGNTAPETSQRVTIKDRISGWVSSLRRGRSPVSSPQQENQTVAEPAITISPTELEITSPSHVLRAPEKTRADYETDHLRETEIKEVWNLLGQHQAVMILGEEGRGKSTFIGEFLRYANTQGIAPGYIEIHQIENATETITLGAAQAITQPYLEWFDKLSSAPLQQRPVLIVDAADILYIHRGMVNTQLYGTVEWNKWQELRKNPEQWRNFVYEKMKDTIHKLHDRDVREAEEWKRQHPGQTYWRQPRSIEESLQGSIKRYDRWMDESIVKAEFIDALGTALRDQKVRLVLTDHNYDRSKITPNVHESAEMMRRYDEAFGQAYRYELPAAFEVDRARLFLEKTYRLEDSTIQDEIIAVTGARPNYMKNGLTSEVIDQVKNSQSPEERRKLLEEAMGKFEPKYLYPSLSATKPA